MDDEEKDNGSRTPNLLIKNDRSYTLDLRKGISVYGEELRKFGGIEYRSFSPSRSKLATVVKKGVWPREMLSADRVLYLGAANGTTVSHVSDLLPSGKIFAVEISPRCFRDLLELGKERDNVYPILGDATKPKDYRYIVGRVDIIYQDVSQRDQAAIFLKNAEAFLEPGGSAYLMVKAGCIDSSRPSEKIFGEVAEQLESDGIVIERKVDLTPYQKGHAAFVLRVP